MVKNSKEKMRLDKFIYLDSLLMWQLSKNKSFARVTPSKKFCDKESSFTFHYEDASVEISVNMNEYSDDFNIAKTKNQKRLHEIVNPGFSASEVGEARQILDELTEKGKSFSFIDPVCNNKITNYFDLLTPLQKVILLHNNDMELIDLFLSYDNKFFDKSDRIISSYLCETAYSNIKNLNENDAKLSTLNRVALFLQVGDLIFKDKMVREACFSGAIKDSILREIQEAIKIQEEHQIESIYCHYIDKKLMVSGDDIYNPGKIITIDAEANKDANKKDTKISNNIKNNSVDIKDTALKFNKEFNEILDESFKELCKSNPEIEYTTEEERANQKKLVQEELVREELVQETEKSLINRVFDSRENLIKTSPPKKPTKCLGGLPSI